MTTGLIALNRPVDSRAEPWEVASDLPGRVRIRSMALLQSPLLLQHCRLVLTSCHWILHFRINRVAGCVCIDYPSHRRRELHWLLDDAMTLSSAKDHLQTDPPTLLSRPTVQRTVAHGVACFALLSLQGPLGVGSWGVGVMTAALLWPLLRESIESLRRRRITVETLELGFSAVLLGQGLAAEALLDLGLNDATEVAQSAVEPDAIRLDSEHLLQRLGSDVEVQVVAADGSRQVQTLDAVAPGITIALSKQEHCFLTATICQGELIVVNRLFNGDWRPRRLTVGDAIQPGVLVISGDAHAVISHCLSSDPAYALLRDHYSSLELQDSAIETWLDRYKAVMPPLLLAAGGAFLTTGSTERAIAAFQFNPVSDWESSNLASRLTAIADLKLHNLRVRNADCLSSLGKIKHLVISRSCLDRLAGIRVREQVHPGAPISNGSLVQLLAGIQHWICGTDATPIWSEQLQRVNNPIAIEHVEIGDLLAGWDVLDSRGQHWHVRQLPQSSETERRHHLDPLEIQLSGIPVGTVNLVTEADEHWVEACKQLRQMGIQLHIVSSQERERLEDISDQLGIHSRHIHGPCLAAERLALVRQLQRKGQGVAYVGYVLSDLPALSQADVSIGLDTDDDSRYSSRICDLSLPANALWLPRMVRISQTLQRSRNQNFTLLAGTQLLSSLATAAGLLAPLETVLLADIPLLLAELNNVCALQNRQNPISRRSIQLNS